MKKLGIISITLAMLLAFMSCNNGTTGSGNNSGDDNNPSGNNNPGGGSAFMAVTGITGVPGAGTVGTPLTLTGTVAPANATNKTITWTVASAGTTGAAISGNALSATAAGTVTVRATIANGTAPGTAFTRDFTVTIAATGGTVQGTYINDYLGDGSLLYILTFTGSNFSLTSSWGNGTGSSHYFSGAFAVSGNSVVCTIANSGGVKTFTIIDENTLYISRQSLGQNGEGNYKRGQPSTGNPGTFVAVTNITGVPTIGTAGTPLTLTATVTPANATNKTIVWTVVGTTFQPNPALIFWLEGNTLTVQYPGYVTVRATIADGKAQGTDYTQDFDITFQSQAALPAAPTGVKTTITSSTSIRFSWNTVQGATSYNVYISEGSGNWNGFIEVTDTFYNHNDVRKEITYYYKVTAVNSAGEGPDSAIIYDTTMQALPR